MMNTPTNQRSPFRIGIVETANSSMLGDFVERLKRGNEAEVIAIIRIPATDPPPHAPLLFKLWSRVDAWCWDKGNSSTSPALDGIRVITVRPSPKENEPQRLSSSHLAQIRECNLDVLLQPGPEAPIHDLASCARYGLWSFTFNCENSANIHVPMFWDLYAGRATHDITLNVTRGFETPACIIYSGRVQANPFSLSKNDRLYWEQRASAFINSLRKLRERGWDGIVLANADPSTRSNSDLRPFPSNLAMLVFLVRWCKRASIHAFTKLFFREQWSIVCRAAEKHSTEWGQASSIRLLTPRSGHYADPFLVTRNDRSYLFFEKYSSSERGTIWCTELGRDGSPLEMKEVLAAPYHLSYPFIFEWQNETYLIPETWENRTVEVYRASPFPFRWELAGLLLRDITATDPTVLEYNGKLWLFVAGVAGLGTECTELSLFFSDSLFGEWHSHPKNPVVCDVRRARPAGGVFFQDGKLIRPGQDCAKRYGHAVTLNRIDVLSETEYSEVPIASISPESIPGCCASHTLNHVAGFCVMDGKVRIPVLPLRLPRLPRRTPIPGRFPSSMQHLTHQSISQQLFAPQKKRAISQSPSSL